MKYLHNNTPVEIYNGYLVKREDLCAPHGAPPFSKLRGVMAHIAARPFYTIAALDTYHSKAGWAVAYACDVLNRKAVCYFPVRKSERGEDGNLIQMKPQQQAVELLGGDTVELQAGRSAILFHQAKKHLAEHYSGAYMMPNALKIPEMVTETAEEVIRTRKELFSVPRVLTSISSGTIAAGILRGLYLAGWVGELICHMGYSRSITSVRKYVISMSGFSEEQLEEANIRLKFIDAGYAYADRVSVDDIPFPVSPWYDGKAWRWLQQQPLHYGRSTLFWSVGE